MFGGFGEDVSAVMTGWQNNPVPFDTVFNQSYHAWAWGRKRGLNKRYKRNCIVIKKSYMI
jgi:hypothetical protein